MGAMNMNRRKRTKRRTLRPRRLLLAATVVGLTAGLGIADDAFEVLPLPNPIAADGPAAQLELTAPTVNPVREESTARFRLAETESIEAVETPQDTQQENHDFALLPELPGTLEPDAAESKEAIEVWYGGRLMRKQDQANSSALGYKPAEIWYGVPDAKASESSGVRFTPSEIDSTFEGIPQADAEPEASLPAPAENSKPDHQPGETESGNTAPSRFFAAPRWVRPNPPAPEAQHALATTQVDEDASASPASTVNPTPTYGSTPGITGTAEVWHGGNLHAKQDPGTASQLSAIETHAALEELPVQETQAASDADSFSALAFATTLLNRTGNDLHAGSPLIYFTVAMAFMGPVMLLTSLVAMTRIGSNSSRSRSREPEQIPQSNNAAWPAAYPAMPPMMPPAWMSYPMQGWGPQAPTQPTSAAAPANPVAAPIQSEAPPEPAHAEASVSESRFSASKPAASPATGEQAMIRGIFEDNLKIRTRMRGVSGKDE